ncbi:hypothetical protein A2960_03990 [Candidatus Gottesmanbacteria bacterium RIFCSPLOWO2_01_FULL_39_12b]|uniref:Uncharacterized protein n=1 Tax=Candidatus Gottesmanbacteria bacterium RIFCSPLOWO2_01_FULL_39_12b TaxID=1798388 RepID=A0A1F6APB5_9BACT|nr:MAG: hypothetical protein A2960_03990 [Candidatus Gottesmanbacteria bacterium RIFCSPLOWO2_01_FULL_39_12b]
MINSYIRFVIYSFIFLFPLFYTSLTPDSYEINKFVFLIVTALILLLLFTLKVIINKKLTLYKSTFGLILIFLTCVVFISSLFQSPNFTITLITPLSNTTIFFGSLLYFLLIHLVSEEERALLINILIGDGIILSVFVILAFTGILPGSNFTPAGSLLTTSIFLGVLSIYLISRFIEIFMKNSSHKPELESTVYYFVVLLIILSSTGITVFELLTTQKPLILPFQFGWSIFLDVMKNIRTLFLGIGPTNFLPAFTMAKPIAINYSPNWNVFFTSSSSFLLNLATESGIFSAVLFLILLIKSVKLFFSIKNNLFPVICALVTILIIQIFLPATMTIFLATIVLLFLSSSKEESLIINFQNWGSLTYILLVPPLIFTILTLYFGGRAYLAEVMFKSSLDAMVNNRGTEAFNFQKNAVNLNPYVDRYHVAYSQTSLGLANALASKKDIQEADKQNIPRLVQQSIDEARQAVVLNRINVNNWDNLGRNYSALINFAQGSENWAQESYKQKIALDPVNPNSYLVLGGLYLKLNKYEEARNILIQAVNLKSDYATSHYNLAQAYRLLSDHDNAYKQLLITKGLLVSDSEDAKKVDDELKNSTGSALPKE